MHAMSKFIYGAIVTMAVGVNVDSGEVCTGQSCDAQSSDGDYQSLLVTPKHVWRAREAKTVNGSSNITGISKVEGATTPGFNMSAVVISLDRRRRHDRWEAISRSFANSTPWLSYDRLDMFQNHKSPPSEEDVSHFWNTTDLMDSQSSDPVVLKMNPRQLRSCSAHIAAWRMALRNDRALMVMEDDATILPNFSSSFHQALEDAPNGTAILFLSGVDRWKSQHSGVPAMTGYVIFPEGARTLLQRLPINMPLESWLAARVRQGDIKVWNMEGPILSENHDWSVSRSSSDVNDDDYDDYQDSTSDSSSKNQEVDEKETGRGKHQTPRRHGRKNRIGETNQTEAMWRAKDGETRRTRGSNNTLKEWEKPSQRAAGNAGEHTRGTSKLAAGASQHHVDSETNHTNGRLALEEKGNRLKEAFAEVNQTKGNVTLKEVDEVNTTRVRRAPNETSRGLNGTQRMNETAAAGVEE